MTCSTASAGLGGATRTGLAHVLLREIADLLGLLVATGESGSIDLRSLPMTDGDRSDLEVRLGQGEVSAILTVAGTSEIWETAVSGVWWVRHRGEGGRIASEEIVVARVPDILAAHPDDARDSLVRLRTLIETDSTLFHDPSRPEPPVGREYLAQPQEGR